MGFLHAAQAGAVAGSSSKGCSLEWGRGIFFFVVSVVSMRQARLERRERRES